MTSSELCSSGDPPEMLHEIDRRQDEILQQLDQLNDQVLQLLEELSKRLCEGSTNAES